MSKANFVLSVFITAIVGVHAQNPVSIGKPADDTLYANTGENFLLIPDVNDNDPGVEQEITFTVTSSDTDVVEVQDVAYTAGNTVAIVHLIEKGTTGTVTLQIEASDTDGTATTSAEIRVGPYNNPGINFEIHDIVFWQEVVPLDANPAYSMIIDSSYAPYDEIDLEGLKLSVYSDCTAPICTGTDFFTAFFKGYLIPPVSGEYYFYNICGGGRGSIGLSTDESFDNVEVIQYVSPETGMIGTNPVFQEYKSVQVSLESGKSYAIYGTHWNIHDLVGGIMWEGPGIEKAYIPAEYLSYVYDINKPVTVENLTLEGTGIDDIRISWSPSSDDVSLAGYQVYVDGKRAHDLPVTGTTYTATGLSSETKYCVMVTAADWAGNESAESSIVCATTYGPDSNPPSPPSLVEASVIADLAIKIDWSGAYDNESEVRGYNLYVDDILYNGSGLIYEEASFIYDLYPETEYIIEVESIDAAYNVSVRSAPFSVTTLAFDPYETSISDKKARLNIHMNSIARSEGIGVNPDYETGDFLDDPRQLELLDSLEVASIRWGGIGANPMTFSNHIGTGKQITFGELINLCNELDAYSVITCGVSAGSDWMTDPGTFANFLEYVAGPPDSEYGAIRASEGYSASLLEGSRGMIFEFGNEVWGADAHYASIGSDYSVYGAWAREMALLMKASEYYDSTKIFLTYSGRNPVLSDSYGLHEKVLEGDSGEVDWFAVSGYLGGNLTYSPEIDPGKSEGDYYKNGIWEMVRNLEGLDGTMLTIAKYSGELKPFHFYESNMTNNSYYGRLGQAVVQTDYYASAIERGAAIPNIFHFSHGQWKMIIPAQDYQKTPLYHTTRYFNKYCTGDVLESDMETMATISNAAGSKVAADPVGCHVYADGEDYSILLFSRDFEHDYRVQLNLPEEIQLIAPETAKRYLISGANFSAKEATIDSSQFTISDGVIVDLPAFSMVVITFTGNDQGLDPLPLGFYDYVTASSLSIYPYGSDNFVIDSRRSKILRADVLPESLFWDGAVWEVETNGVEVIYGLKSYGFEIEGSGTCGGNGIITVRASAWDNPMVSDEVEVIISNQGTDCENGVDDPRDFISHVYPNPAGETLYMEGLPAASTRISVTDIAGRVCLTQMVSGPVGELDLSGIAPGIYALVIRDSDEPVVLKFIKE
ncbi:MAG: T9SS type A sorting domain-containing protein [Bacteroidota bacterium]